MEPSNMHNVQGLQWKEWEEIRVVAALPRLSVSSPLSPPLETREGPSTALANGKSWASWGRRSVPGPPYKLLTWRARYTERTANSCNVRHYGPTTSRRPRPTKPTEGDPFRPFLIPDILRTSPSNSRPLRKPCAHHFRERFQSPRGAPDKSWAPGRV